MATKQKETAAVADPFTPSTTDNTAGTVPLESKANVTIVDSETDPWDDVTSVAVEPEMVIVADIPVPPKVLEIVAQAVDEKTARLVKIDGWADERVKELEKHIRNAKGALALTRIRATRVIVKGEKYMRVSASREVPASKKNTSAEKTA